MNAVPLSHNWRTWVIGYSGALAAVTLVSLFLGLVLGQVNLANASMLYLLAVMGTAVRWGRGPAVFASIGAFLVFDWFFVAPAHQLTVSNPDEWLSLLLFLLTATVTGQLAASQRQRAEEARSRQREAVVLYDIVRLLGEGNAEEVLQSVAERLRSELRLDAVGIELAQAGGASTLVSAGDAARLRQATTAGRVMQSRIRQSEDGHAAPGRWVRVVRAQHAFAVREAIHRVPIRSSDRLVGALLLAGSSDAFDRADDRLLSAAAAQIGLAHERTRLRQEATDAEILRRTDQLRTALLNAVSHDLRTPLATIMASAGSLRQQDVAWTDEERQSFAQTIEEEADHLNHLVGNVLDLSRIEGGSLRPRQSWQDVDTLVEDVLERLKPVLREHTVHVEIEADLPPVWLDPVEIGEVIYNLVENAAKYAASRTEISVRARTDGPAVTLTVEDRGPGIADADLRRLFDPFYRAMDGPAQPRGLGLGLAIVKGLVEAHGGRVWAENRPGGGARFTFSLPLGEMPRDLVSLVASPG